MKHISTLLILLSLITTAFSQRQSDADILKVIQLPRPKTSGTMSLEQALASRRSVRNFSEKTLDYVQIGQIAWAAQGITDLKTGFRTAPSAGAIFPIEIFVANEEGLFVYQPESHSLKQILPQDIRKDLARAAYGQNCVAQVPCDIIIAGSIQKVAEKYNRKAREFTLLEAGHVAQNIHLQAVSLGLGSVAVGVFDPGAVRKIYRTGLEPFYIIPVGYPAAVKISNEPNIQTEVSKMQDSKNKKAVLIIASSNFRDEELFETQKALEQANIQTTVASSQKGEIRGILRGKAQASMLISMIDVNDYNAIIFVGGSGAKEYFDNKTALDIAKQTIAKNKILAAICIAPTILANAGVLEGVSVTSFESERIKLQKAGAKFTGVDVQIHGKIITASGPHAAARFGKAIAQEIEKN